MRARSCGNTWMHISFQLPIGVSCDDYQPEVANLRKFNSPAQCEFHSVVEEGDQCSPLPTRLTISLKGGVFPTRIFYSNKSKKKQFWSFIPVRVLGSQMSLFQPYFSGRLYKLQHATNSAPSSDLGFIHVVEQLSLRIGQRIVPHQSGNPEIGPNSGFFQPQPPFARPSPHL